MTPFLNRFNNRFYTYFTLYSSREDSSLPWCFYNQNSENPISRVQKAMRSFRAFSTNMSRLILPTVYVANFNNAFSFKNVEKDICGGDVFL